MTAVTPAEPQRSPERIGSFFRRCWQRVRALPIVVLVILLFGVWLATITAVRPPTFALDGDWQNGVSWAALTGKQFGKSIDFTYGPWGYLDEPTLLSGRQFDLAAVATVVSGIFFALVAWRLARRWLPRLASALVVTLVVIPAMTSAAGFSSRVLLLSVMCAVGLSLGSIAAGWQRPILVVLAIVAGLALLSKFSNGTLAIATVVLIAALCTGGGFLRRAVTTVITLAISLTSVSLFWLFAGQNPGNLVPWFSASLQLTSGYAEAMSTEDRSLLEQYGVLLVLVVILVIQAAMRRGSSRIILLIFVAWAFFVALRLGFTRHDLEHTPQAFMLLLVVGLGLGVTRQLWLSLVGVFVSTVAVLTSGTSYLELVNPVTAALNTRSAVAAMVSPAYRTGILDSARQTGAAQYQVPASVVSALRGKTVHIDPIDSNVAWVYSMNWDPVPVFQSYSAYTPALDSIDASYLTSASGPRAVLRSTLNAIDSRNAMWESPLYMQSLVCDFVPKITSTSWQLLERTEDRCGSAAVLSRVNFAPGQKLLVPAAPGAGYMIVARFTVTNSPLNWLATEVFKPVSKVIVTSNQGDFRLPRAHAGGPLILTLPRSAGWVDQFGGNTDLTSFSVNATGSVVFSAIPVATGK
jgi:hypothetical protein